jgi:hypothetical protein
LWKISEIASDDGGFGEQRWVALWKISEIASDDGGFGEQRGVAFAASHSKLVIEKLKCIG